MDRQQGSSNTCIAIDRANKKSPSKIVDFAIAVAIVAARFRAPRGPAGILRLRGGLDTGMERGAGHKKAQLDVRSDQERRQAVQGR